jgi:hypothetical protein
MTGQGKMQRRRSHVDGANSSLATAQASEATVVGGTGGDYCSVPTAQSYNQGSLTHRLHAHELTTRVEQRVFGLGDRRLHHPTLYGRCSSGGQ